MTLITRAQAYAHAAHDSIGQVRKYSGEPYWVHTDEVAEIVASVTQDAHTIAVAHLHDVLEDVPSLDGAPFSIEHLRAEFGREIAIDVKHLTDIFTSKAYPWLNRDKRKALERARLAQTDARIHSIKIADLISNTKSIVTDDPDFAVTYMAEKALFLPLLRRGHPELMARAKQQLEEYTK
jgi:guanosine-3',5'-bis(diphosphate) 3'-pyrophosphohydrolase